MDANPGFDGTEVTKIMTIRFQDHIKKNQTTV